MFGIRRIYDEVIPVNREALSQVKQIVRARFAAVPQEEVEGLEEKLRNPFKQKFRTILYVAEKPQSQQVIGFGVMMHDPEQNFCYLDFIATAPGVAKRGVGGALYEHIREEARDFKAKGLFFECLPDTPRECPEEVRRENMARLRFYEQYGARPVMRNDYQAPVKPGDTCMPFLVYDALDGDRPLRRSFVRGVVRAILERKYGYLCPPEYVEKVIGSFRDDPVPLREPRYPKKVDTCPAPKVSAVREPIALVVNQNHEIHHIKERGYVESPVRIKSILGEILNTGLFVQRQTKEFPEKFIKAVHDSAFVEYLKRACASVPEKKSLYPYVFPIRNATRPPKELSVRAGYYCIDTFTPITGNAYLAARRAVDCTLTAAESLLAGYHFAYSLIRPPGHHAERRLFGGFCYFNNAAIAAHHLSAFGRVAILGLDYHHGNGQQDIFYSRADVLTVSIHGHPNFAYPYFSGFAGERGEGLGKGFNVNYPLAENIDGGLYRTVLKEALERVEKFRPVVLVVCLGFDTAKGDPTGTWTLKAKDFDTNGRMVAALSLPTLIVQEGGYRTKTLGNNAKNFFRGLFEGARRL